ncbi:hypothetical protein RDWZM_002365 [Blomia tropicalis]|uniref:JmjC domain-containing protein n=1 Tax=Blomia tropicalis TaxID=40697 RepID=A0A9Q0MHR2_BLOTA|nr:hypothetical protein RDWZM_002365 [Blomia tropicalis]
MPSPNIGNEATAVVLANSTTTNTTAPYPMHLTPEEMKELSMVDGSMFAFEVALLNRTLTLEKSDQNSCNQIASNIKARNIDPKIYCRLGHYNLLLGNYSKALSAYQQYYELEPNNWKDSSFLFCFGLVYFHFNAFPWAIKTFKKLIYVEPSFSRINEVHIRLGLIFKTFKQYTLAFKHFRLALADLSQCTFGKQEINFHIAHLYEIQGKYATAKELYLSILKDENLNPTLRADTLRQLGWMFHTSESLGEHGFRQSQAINYLKASIEFNPDSSQSYYYLGRSYASVNKVHDAFMSYRNSVEKAEANADTWCSIGVLYQQQNQPLDALQAYICSAQLNRDHEAAWTNLGILYESFNQVHDAYRCYLHATKGKGTKANQDLVDRLNFLKPNLSNIPQIVPQSSQTKLPSVEEAWNHSVSNEMASRQGSNYRQPIMPPDDHTAKRHKSEMPMVPGRVSLNYPPNTYFGDNLQTTPAPQSNQMTKAHITNGQISSETFSLPHQKTMSSSIPVQPMTLATSNNNHTKPVTGRSFRDSIDSDVLSNHTHSSDESSSIVGTPESKDTYSSQFNQFCNSTAHHNLNVSCPANNNFILTKEKEEAITSLLCPTTQQSNHQVHSTGSSPNSNQINYHPNPSILQQPQLSIDMTAEQIIETCQKCPIGTKIITSIATDDGRPVYPPDPPYPPVPKHKLNPPTPIVTIDSKREAFSPKLQHFCLSNPIALIRGLASTLKLDLGLFSTKALVDFNAEHTVEVRRQYLQSSDENWDPDHQEQIWHCESTRSHTTIAKYGNYQANSFSESLKDEQEKGSSSSFRDSDSDSNSTFPKFKKQRKFGALKPVKFGTNVDLSDEKIWKAQLQELTKLPSFARVVSAGNMLSHVGHVILGMNTVQLYMKVPGCRTPGHQENNNFCSVNINIGPGDCEWFGVQAEYWGILSQICERHNISYLHGSWWPILKDCYNENIPVFRFTQKPGDIVWVGAGTVHWVQANGWCNNIAWNVGPFTTEQYRLAVDRYEWNKHESYKSIVPMIHLTWNIVKNVKISDSSLFILLKKVLVRSLKTCVMIMSYVKHYNRDIRFHGKAKDETVHYCIVCEIEVFNLLFIRGRHERKHSVYCFDCSRKIDPELRDFVILEEYTIKELVDAYNKFNLYSISN